MAHITTEQALQIPQQLKRQDSHSDLGGHSNTPDETGAKNASILGDDPVTLLNLQAHTARKQLKIDGYKGELGQYNTFVNDTLKNKLAEYGLNPNTKLVVQKDTFGNLDINGAIPRQVSERLKLDLNNSQGFKDAFRHLSDQSPTLDYVDNVVKISNAYGVNNDLFSSLLSENEENNRLRDIAVRYQSMRSQNELQENAYVQDEPGENFAFYYN